MPYVRTDGVQIALNWDNLVDNCDNKTCIEVPIQLDENGKELVQVVWTGTTTLADGIDGIAATELDCEDWTNNDASDNLGTVGLSTDTSSGWTQNELAFGTCNNEAALYCVQQVYRWYIDGDKDGYGDKDASPILSSTDPGNDVDYYVEDNTDCNDAYDTVHPGAPEIDDELDNDCDDLEDEPYTIGGLGPAGGMVFHVEVDGFHGTEIVQPNTDEYFWGCLETKVEGTLDDDGPGNTLLMSECDEVDGLASQALAFSNNGYGGWYVPTLDELDRLFNNVRETPFWVFTGENFWSSLQFEGCCDHWAHYYYFDPDASQPPGPNSGPKVGWPVFALFVRTF